VGEGVGVGEGDGVRHGDGEGEGEMTDDADLVVRLYAMADELWQADEHEGAAALFTAMAIIIREYRVSWRRRETQATATDREGQQKS
jgi:hypothetical protein